MARVFGNVDILAGLSALAWAAISITVVPELGELVDPRAAGGFALVALGRGYTRLRNRRGDK